MSPRLTLAKTKLPTKTDKLHPPIVLYILNTNTVDCFRKILHHRHWIQRPGIRLVLLLIMLAFLTMVQERRGLKMRPHLVQHIVMPTGSISYAHNGYFAFQIYSSTRKMKENSVTYKYQLSVCLFCYCINDIIENHSTFNM